MTGHIIFNYINVNDCSHNSGVFIGPSNNSSRDTHHKQNIIINGPVDIIQINTINVINDNDILDRIHALLKARYSFM